MAETEVKDATQMKVIKISEILTDLKSGVTRWKKEDLGFGSIEEKYSLKFAEMKQVMNHPKIKGIRTTIPSLLLVDDTDTEVEAPTVSPDEPAITVVEPVVKTAPVKAEVTVAPELVQAVAIEKKEVTPMKTFI